MTITSHWVLRTLKSIALQPNVARPSGFSTSSKYQKAASASDTSTPWDRHCDTETKSAVAGEVIGKLPKWLRGRLIRNGPGARHVGQDTYRHLFDGLALLHMVNIEDGKAHYTSRFLESDSYTLNKRANRIVVSEFGTAGTPDPCLSLFGKFNAQFQTLAGRKLTDNCSVNVLQVKDELLAMTETSTVRVVDPTNLDTKTQKYSYPHYCSVNMATAHPHVAEDGTVYNTGLSIKGGPPSYAILALEGGKISNAKVVGSAVCRWKFNPGYMHSFGMSENYFILCETPLAMDAVRLMMPKVVAAKTVGNALKFHKGAKTRFRVISKATGKELELNISAADFFSFHFINCFESNGCIVVDLCATDDVDITNMLWMSNLCAEDDKMRKVTKITPRRYVLPVSDISGTEVGVNLIEDMPEASIVRPGYSSSATAVKDKDGNIDLTPAIVADMMMELPRINYKHNTKSYQFSYGIHVNDCSKQSFGLDGITKLNMTTGEQKVWKDTKFYSSEPIFVAHPEAKSEDDGVVISLLLHKEDPRKVAFIVLDAKSLEETARVTFVADGVVTPTFHGQFLAADRDQQLY